MAHATSVVGFSLEQRVQEIGHRLLELEKQNVIKTENRWVDWFIAKIMANENFKVQALRFVDVLPALTDVDELHRHLVEYFDSDEMNFPALLRWGLKRSGLNKSILARLVRKLTLQFSHYYMAGATSEDALKTVLELREKGFGFTLDLLGEGVVSEDEAQDYQNQYLKIIPELASTIGRDLTTPLAYSANEHYYPSLHISLKASSLYSQISPLDYRGSYEGIASRLRPIFFAARENGVGVCLDMEQYDYKELLIECFKSILMEPEFRDWGGAGIAIQAYLKEARVDLESLIQWSRNRAYPITIRLVRGAYWDYETVIAKQHDWLTPVWQNKHDTDQSYESCLELLIGNHDYVRTAVATHNIRSIAVAVALAEHNSLSNDKFEFQMLYGMARSLHPVIPALGYPLRLYVPFGDPLPGMAYLVRRLLENSTSQSFEQLNFSQLNRQELLSPPKPSSSGNRRPSNRSVLPSQPSSFKNEALYRFVDPLQRKKFAETVVSVESNLGETYSIKIDGREIDSDVYIESINPAHPRQLVGRVASANSGHVDKAIDGAQTAFSQWSRCSVEHRAALLLNAVELLRKRRMAFAALEIFEAGKTWREADANVTEAIDFLEYYAREAIGIMTPDRKNVPGESNLLWYRPRGVGVIIPPWNFPLAIMAGMVSAAIVTGNTVILKPSSQTPVIAAKFIELLHECGIPPSVVQFLPGPGSDVGEYLVQHPKIHFVAFTGSREVGTRIIEIASRLAPGQYHVKKVIAEMGGKNALIVDSDADLDEAVPGVLKSAFGYQGQKCSACSRVIVIESLSSLLMKRLLAAARSIKIGFPENPAVYMGPVIDSSAKKRILQAIEKGKEEAKLALKTDCSSLDDGYFIGPTIFENVNPSSTLGQQEIFGPVLSVMTAKNFDDAVEIANDTAYALTGGVYSRSPGNIEKAKDCFEVGNLYINREITGALVNRQPFGGFKLSGVGSKAGGGDYLLQFLNPCTFTEKTLRRGFAPN